MILNILDIKPEVEYVEKTITVNSNNPPLQQIRGFPKQLHRQSLSQSEVRKIVIDQIDPSHYPEINDSMYFAVDPDYFYVFAEWFGLDEMKWMPNIDGNESEEELQTFFGDCNVFGHGLKGIAGIWDSTLAVAECLGSFNGSGTYHFTNLIIDEYKKVRRWEPQTNQWELLNSDDDIRYVRF